MDPPEVGPIWYPGMPGPEEARRGKTKYTTMPHSTLPCGLVLQVLRSRRSDQVEVPANPGSYGTSISRSQTVSRSVRTGETRWGSSTGLLAYARGALPLVALGQGK